VKYIVRMVVGSISVAASSFLFDGITATDVFSACAWLCLGIALCWHSDSTPSS
jgi:hypothetical protein